MSKLCWNCYQRKSCTKCSACLVALYCSKECQAENWKAKGHKAECAYWKKEAANPYELLVDTIPADTEPSVIERAKGYISSLSNPSTDGNQKILTIRHVFGNRDDESKDPDSCKIMTGFGYDVLVSLMKEDISLGASRQIFPNLPPSYALFNILLVYSNNQIIKFRSKNFLLTPSAFDTLIKYCYFYTKECPMAIQTGFTMIWWRYMNCLFVHPILCNIALKFLHEDQTTGGFILSKLIKTLLSGNDKKIPDNIEGNIFQMVALIELQSEEEVLGITEGVKKAPIFRYIIGGSQLKLLYDNIAKPCALQYISSQKIRR